MSPVIFGQNWKEMIGMYLFFITLDWTILATLLVLKGWYLREIWSTCGEEGLGNSDECMGMFVYDKLFGVFKLGSRIKEQICTQCIYNH